MGGEGGPSRQVQTATHCIVVDRLCMVPMRLVELGMGLGYSFTWHLVGQLALVWSPG